MSEQKTTPLMQQYFDIKAQYPGVILLFQVGDFYELFFEDAKIVSKFLAIALTSRGKNHGEDIPLCGVPIHALSHYLNKLIKGGFKVAICDQITKPVPGKVVERAVTQVFTPGTLTESSLLDEKSASYIVSLYPEKKNYGLIFTELLTAQLFATIIPINENKILESELARFLPDEIILPKNILNKNFNNYISYFKNLGYLVSFSEIIQDNNNNNNLNINFPEQFKNQFDSKTQESINKYPELNNSLANLYFYLKKTQEKSLLQFNKISFYQPEDYLILDSATFKNLEIFKNNQNGSRENSLLSILDKSKTAMGSRTIKKWLARPLINKTQIIERNKVVTVFCKNIDIMQKLEELLGSLSDIERITGRIALRRANRLDYLSLKDSLKLMPELKLILFNITDLELIKIITEKISNFYNLINLLESSISQDLSSEYIIKQNFDLQLDRLRSLVENSQQEVLKLEELEIKNTGINSLKIRFNNISGYYIEITNTNLDSVPNNYIELQKLTNRKRYTTQELKNLELEILTAQNEIDNVQAQVFERVKDEVEIYLHDLRQLSQAICYLDALFGLAKAAYENNYITPVFNDNNEINIINGRHPVVEQKLENSFEPNNTSLNNKEKLWIITGPNMGGKSTYLRQVALICIIAQIGSLVPASMASLPILDRIFTRIGSGDNLADGKSTFLVEMEETATICSQATKNSLVILDEVGRGTSTFDGIALAQAIIEHIYTNIKANCLFATHYHELTELEKIFENIKNYHMLSKKIDDKVIFLHKIAPGIADGSFGIEVAKLAQLPTKVITRASEILQSITQEHSPLKNSNFQKNIFNLNKISQEENINILLDKIIILENKLKQKELDLIKLETIKNINLDDFSPKQAFDLLWKIKNKFD
ncbi:MAG: mismatch repair protein MutS protein [candidate division TM6 bacterium GW2011_GWF2_28_16]|nr:MAG: mismatch repair protein MutS protein [candidate division TM6 bacterium GW2011_GWF2_28_16]